MDMGDEFLEKKARAWILAIAVDCVDIFSDVVNGEIFEGV
jgi:hypothetical protein